VTRAREDWRRITSKDTGAHRYLTALSVESPEADAERLHYILLCAQFNNREA
jgi:hypothetical protein